MGGPENGNFLILCKEISLHRGRGGGSKKPKNPFTYFKYGPLFFLEMQGCARFLSVFSAVYLDKQKKFITKSNLKIGKDSSFPIQ